jgi:hypothetical protein
MKIAQRSSRELLEQSDIIPLPRLLMRRSFGFPPVVAWRGTKPSQAAIGDRFRIAVVVLSEPSRHARNKMQRLTRAHARSLPFSDGSHYDLPAERRAQEPSNIIEFFTKSLLITPPRFQVRKPCAAEIPGCLTTRR